MRGEIDRIIKNYVNGEWSYSYFSNSITPYIFKAIANEIDDIDLRKYLLSIFDLIEVFLDDENFYEHDLKKNLKGMMGWQITSEI